MPNAYTTTIRSGIVSELKLDGFTETEQDEIIDFLEENSLMQVHLDLLECLTALDKEEFYRISEKKQPEAIEAFLKEKIPEYKKVISKAATKVVREFKRLQSL